MGLLVLFLWNEIAVSRTQTVKSMLMKFVPATQYDDVTWNYKVINAAAN